MAQINGHSKGVTKILPSVLQFIGNTPMIKLNKIPQSLGIECEVLLKCELFNAGGSHKDRIAVRMIEDAEKKGLLKPGISTIIEPTSGNTGIGVAMVAAVKGYACILVMPEKMSSEKMDTMHALGAKIIRTPNVPTGHPEAHIAVAKRLLTEIPNSFMLDQYENEGNSKVHYDDTSEEIIDQCDGNIDMMVIGAGTGGAITGIGRKLKEKCKGCIIVGIDPDGSIMAQPIEMNAPTKGNFWEVEGIGHDFLPAVLDLGAVDKWYKCADKDSFLMARRIISEEGILVGGSSGTALVGAFEAIREAKLGKGKRCVVLIPDSIRNYMTKFLSDQWMLERGFLPKEEAELEAKHSWWKLPVSSLKTKGKTDVVRVGESIKEALDIMNKGNLKQLPVVDNDNCFKGVVTMENLLKKTMEGSLQSCDLVEKHLGQSKKVTLETPLGKLAHLLKGQSFVFLTLDSDKNKEVFGGLLSQVDLVNFTSGIQKC